MADNVVQVDRGQLAAVEARLQGIANGLPRALSGAVNDTVAKEKTNMSREIRAQVNIKKKDIDPRLTRTRATPGNPQASITLAKTSRLPLKYFGAKQTKRGVTYKIAKGASRSLLPSAFGPNIDRLGNHVYVRAGKDRLPIVKVMAISAWGAFVKNNLEAPTVADAERVLEHNLERRCRAVLLKSQGKI